MPRVSVLMPAYNVAEYIEESIDSVLNQTYSDWELVIVNDCSTDQTVDIINKYTDPRIRLVHTPQNLKLCGALNFGLEHCRGEFVARLDSDDNATPNRLELQVKALDENPDWALVGGLSNKIDAEGNLLRKWEEGHGPSHPKIIRYALIFRNVFRHSTVTFRRQVVVGIGGYPVEWHKIEDYGLWVKLASKRFSLANLAAPFCDYRVREGSMMVRDAQIVAQTRMQPRRTTVEDIYSCSVTTMGASADLAEAWGRIWGQVRMPNPDEKLDLKHALKTLNRVVALGKAERIHKKQWNEITRYPYLQLLKIALKQKACFESGRIMIAATRQVGIGVLLKSMISGYSTKSSQS